MTNQMPEALRELIRNPHGPHPEHLREAIAELCSPTERPVNVIDNEFISRTVRDQRE